MRVLLLAALILAASISAASSLLLPLSPNRGLRLPSLPSKSAKEGQPTATVQEQNNQAPSSVTIKLPPFDPISSVALLTLVFMAWKLAELSGLQGEQGKVLVELGKVQVEQGKMLVEQGKMLGELSTSVKVLDSKFSQFGSNFALFGNLFTVAPISFGILIMASMSAFERFNQGRDVKQADTNGKTDV